MSTLTNEQIATFARYRTGVVNYLHANSEPTENSVNREIKPVAFHAIAKVAFRPSKLRPVMKNLTSLGAIGRTKENFQKRDQDGNLVFNADSSPQMACRIPHCVMFTADAFRAEREKQTGLKTHEPVYTIPWTELDKGMQDRLSAKFPDATFQPLRVGIMVRNGNKPAKGQKRHTWQRMTFVVVGKYGAFGTCVIPNAAVWASGNTLELGELLNIPREDIPVWDKEEAPKEDMKKAANAQADMSPEDHANFFFPDF